MSDEAVVAACRSIWPKDKGDCSAFARDVAHSLGIALAGDADDIVDQISGSGWKQISGGAAAAQAAEDGQFVIAGLRGDQQQLPSAHGHVVVVVGGEPAQGKYPYAYWGRLGGVGAENKTINWAWRAGDRDHVVYAAKSLA